MPLSTSTATELTREQVLTTLVKPLEAASVFLAAGPRIIDTAGPLRIPYGPDFGDDPVPMTGENELIPELDPTFDDMQLLPSTMKSFKVIHRYSNEVARQSVVALETVLRAGLVSKVAAQVDQALMGSTGDGITAPRGIGAYEGVQTVDVSTSIQGLRLDHVLQGQGLMLAANTSTTGLTLFCRVDDYMNMRLTRDLGANAWNLEPDVQSGKLVVPILGATVVPTDRIAAGTAYLVHMPSIIVARDVAPSVRILTERYADFDQVGIRVVTRLDAAPLHPEAVVKFEGIVTPDPLVL